MPQSTSRRFPAASTRYFDPVTVPAAPRNVSLAISEPLYRIRGGLPRRCRKEDDYHVRWDGPARLRSVGGADGIRTHDLLDAIEARSQLRHGPTGGTNKVYHSARERVPPGESANDYISDRRSSLRSSSCSTLRKTSSLMRPSSRNFMAVWRSARSNSRANST